MVDHFDGSKGTCFDEKAYALGQKVRREGGSIQELNVNPWAGCAFTDWKFRSFCAGWVFVDDLLRKAEKVR